MKKIHIFIIVIGVSGTLLLTEVISTNNILNRLLNQNDDTAITNGFQKNVLVA